MNVSTLEHRKKTSQKPMRLALLQLCEELDNSDFVALSSGIGLDTKLKQINFDDSPIEPSHNTPKQHTQTIAAVATAKNNTVIVNSVVEESTSPTKIEIKPQQVQETSKTKKIKSKRNTISLKVKLVNLIITMKRNLDNRRLTRKNLALTKQKAREELKLQKLVEANVRKSVVQEHVQNTPNIQLQNPFAQVQSPTQTQTIQHSRSRKIVKWILAHSIDIGVVLFSLVVSLLFVSNVLLPVPSKVGALNPILKFVLNLSLFEFACCLYMFFIFYWVLFKIFIGTTLGQYAIGLKKI